MDLIIDNLALMTNQELVDLLQDYSKRLVYGYSVSVHNQYIGYVEQIKSEILKRMSNA